MTLEQGDCNGVKDGSLIISAILGGALGIYIGMFILKYRTRSLVLMAFMPVIVVMNIYLIIVGFMNDFWIIEGAMGGLN